MTAIKKGKGLIENLIPEKKKKTSLNTAQALKALIVYFDLAAKVYTLLSSDASKYFSKLGKNAARNALVLASLQIMVRAQDKDARHAVLKVLREEETYIKTHPRTPVAMIFSQIQPEFEALLESE